MKPVGAGRREAEEDEGREKGCVLGAGRQVWLLHMSTRAGPWALNVLVNMGTS